MNLELVLNEKPYLQKHLFEKGFLITNDSIDKENLSKYPFYGNWNVVNFEGYNFYINKEVKYYFYKGKEASMFLIGHAFNPFTSVVDESKILSTISEKEGEEYYDYISELTGIFILGKISKNNIEVVLDCSGMQYACYGEINEKLYISSHMQLLGDLLSLQQSAYVKKLINYKWYKYMYGNYLPGDITCFEQIKRIIPNTYVSYTFESKFKTKRFYPNKNIMPCKTEEEYNKVIEEASNILKNTMSLIPLKWKRPAISLTGGIDSNTTFAATNGNYDKYTTFSYVAMFRESVDAEAAKTISEKFNVPYKKYEVSEKNEDFIDFNIYKAIFAHNDGDIGPLKDDDTRKKITLINNDVCDVEVKSWISETIRAYAYKYFDLKKMPKNLKPRHYTSLYKIFLMNRKLVWNTDKHFDNYIKKTKLKEHLFNYDESDIFVWEMIHGGKCSLNIGVMKSCFDIVIPYNNRKLLDLLLKVPLDRRISDRHHLDMKKLLNRELYDMNIRVVNLNETKKRKRFAKLYFKINSFLPF